MSSKLPVKKALTLPARITVWACLLMGAASLAGLLWPQTMYTSEAAMASFQANDVVTLIIGIPILLGAMLLAQRGSLAALLAWPGAFVYSIYNYLAYVIGAPLGWQTAVFTVILALNLYGAIEVLRSLDVAGISRKLASKVPSGLSGWAMAVLGLLFLGLAGSTLASSPSLPDAGVAVADIFISALLLGCGITLIRRTIWGYAGGLAMLFAGTALFVGVVLVVALQPLFSGGPLAVEDLVVLLGMGLVCFVPFGLYLRGVLNVAGATHA